MDIYVEHPGGVACVTVAVEATVAELRDAVAECLRLVPWRTALAHEGGAPLGAADGALDVPLRDVLCSDTVQLRPPSCGLGLRCEDLVPALSAELAAGRSGSERAQQLLCALRPSHWRRGSVRALMRAIRRCPTPAVLEQLLASCGDRLSEGRYKMFPYRPEPWMLRLCLRAGLLLEKGLFVGYGKGWSGAVPSHLLEVMLEEAPQRCFAAGLLHGAVACGDDAMLERCLALGASPAGALRTAIAEGCDVRCAQRLVAAGCVADVGLVLAASQLGRVAWLRWLFDEAGCSVDVADADGRTALHVAGSAEVVRFLAARGARPDLRRRGGLSVAHRFAGCDVTACSGCPDCYSSHDSDVARLLDQAFAEVLATWPWLVYAEDWEGNTALRWIWLKALLSSQDYYSQDYRCDTSTRRTIERSHLLVDFGADVQAMAGLQTINFLNVAVHVVRDATGHENLCFKQWDEDASDGQMLSDAAEIHDDAYDRLCCRVKRSDRPKRRQTRRHKYRAWVLPER